MKVLLSILLAGITLMACNKSSGKGDEPGYTTESTLMNVAYGTDAAQKMDIYLPAGRTTAETKVLVLVHGGGWTAGDKSEFDAYIATLKQRLPGYAIFNVNYRLATSNLNRFPVQENDLNAAVEFVAGRQKEYGISDKFVLIGFSAGAHLALLQGYKHTNVIKPKAIVSFFGPTDLVDMYNNPTSQYAPLLLEALVGYKPSQNIDAYNQSSPMYFVTAASPPTMLLHGGLDDLVSYTQSSMLYNKLKSLNVVNQYVFYPNEGHGWFGPTLDDSFSKVQVFLDANVK
jgi:acetyl esterase/lipase